MFVEASSLLESVIAITIIATCLLIATQLYTTVLHNSYSLSQYQANFKVEELWNTAIIKNDFDDAIYNLGDYSIIKTSQNFDDKSDIQHIQFKVVNSKDTINHHYLYSTRKDEQ
ncbi:hypothetical protein NBT05_17325 [Aquimarina sp. ERC-38]|uniref:hypothetical protein n=1 Tax=Aquimarina sp. ERC-38 TaxID=2949996 RepID=UPI002247D688|nr:hypothetical protein [Aquimarina sp. ERC-38]UZO80690.1 hypothetical protein NBT05_17325 [Aquimarina sp. ERC-38]